MDKIAKRKIPSERTIVQKDASMNENIIAFCRYFKNITTDVMPNKINNGSVIPNKEFNINRGSNANKATPTRAIFASKNFLHKKYTGIVINPDSDIEIIRSNCIY